MNLTQTLRRGVMNVVEGIASRLDRRGSKLGRRLMRRFDSARQDQSQRERSEETATTRPQTTPISKEDQPNRVPPPMPETVQTMVNGAGPAAWADTTAWDDNDTGEVVHERPELYEPQEREARVPRGERHLSSMRRGA